MMDLNVILNSLTVAMLVWIGASVSGLRERVAVLEAVFKIQRKKGTEECQG